MKKIHHLSVAATFFLLGLAGPAVMYGQTKRGITPEDYFSFKFISDPHLSPDGKAAAFVLTTIDQKKNRRESSVWFVSADGSAPPRRLTAEGFSSSSPRWSPDGKTLGILSARNSDSSASEKPKVQICLLPMTSGGEGIVLTKLRNGVESYQWSPDGKRVAIVSSSGPSDEIAQADRKSDVRHYGHILYKFNDTGWYDDKRQHLWVANAQSGETKQITDGQEWNDTDPQWSPDGTRIAFVSDRTGKLYDDSHNTDVWVIPASGGSLTKISDHAFEDESPRWSPDGKQILFTGKTAYHQFSKLYVANSSGRAASQLAVNDLDLIPTELHWAAPGELLFAAGVRAETHIFQADPAARTFSKVTSGSRGVHGFDVNESAGKLVYLASDFQHQDDLYVSSLDGTNELQLTHLNSTLWTALDLQPVERLQYESTDGWPVEGFLVKPVGWQPGKKYPMVLVIHGGPRGMFGVDWYHEFHVYSARGWAVFFCNPRGSTSYGEKFERGEINNWGVMDYQDVMAGVGEAITLLEELGEEARIIAGGQSLIPLMKMRMARPSALVDINFIAGLSYIKAHTGELRFGALVRHADIEDSEVAAAIPIVHDCAAGIADVQVRNQGTIGGSLAEADPSGDWGTVLLTLETSVRCFGPGGERTVALEEFIKDAYTTVLGHQELVTEVIVRFPPNCSGGAHLALKRSAPVYPTVSVAAQVTLEGKDTCKDIRIVMGCVGLTAIRAKEAEAMLRGKTLNEKAVQAAAESARETAEPQSDMRGSADYKRVLLAALVKRAIGIATRRARGERVEAGHEYVGR